MTSKGMNLMREHIIEQCVEDAKFLIDCGEPIDRIAKRLGVPVETLEKRLERSR